MIKLFKKIFCNHDWETRTKKDYNWSETKLVKGTEHWYRGAFEEVYYSKTIETFICKKCGCIHVLEYQSKNGNSTNNVN